LDCRCKFLDRDFNEQQHSATALRTIITTPLRLYPNTWTPVDNVTLETGLRGRLCKPYGFELLPRFSALLKLTPEAGGKVGAEAWVTKHQRYLRRSGKKTISKHPCLSINRRQTTNGRQEETLMLTTEPGWVLSASPRINCSFTRGCAEPLVLTPSAGGSYAFVNADGYIDTKGIETNLRSPYGDLNCL
jgi:iron complex outermembrane receptor protein